MKYEVDQSAKIEQTNKDTVISIANKEYSYSIKINSKIKQSLQKYFNLIRKPKMFAVYLFTTGLIILIKKSGVKNSVVTIDLEYLGYNKVISNELSKNTNQDLDFRFSNIGKGSPAHDSAYKTFKKKTKPDYVASKSEVEAIIFKMISTGGSI